MSKINIFKFKIIKRHKILSKNKDQDDLISYEEFIKKYFVKLITDSSFNISNKIIIKQKKQL